MKTYKIELTEVEAAVIKNVLQNTEHDLDKWTEPDDEDLLMIKVCNNVSKKIYNTFWGKN